MTPRDRILALLRERRAYPVGSLDREYRERAAWKLIQIARRVPASQWTDAPRPKPQYRMAAE